MNKKKITILISAVLLIAVVFSGFYVFNNLLNSKDTFSYGSNNLQSTDTNLVSISDINKVLKVCNYNGINMECFSSASLFSKPSIYYMYWVLNVMSDSGYKLSQVNNTSNISNLMNLLKSTNLDLDNLRMATGIYSLLKPQGFDKGFVMNEVTKHYDTKSKLFFWKKQDESIADKISATYVALNIINNIGMLKEAKMIPDIKSQLLIMYGEDKFFTLDNANNTIINNGGVIVNSLKILGYKNEIVSESVKEKRLSWLNYWNKNITNSLKSDYFSMLLLNEIVKINLFYGSDFPIQKEYWNDFFNNHSSFYGLGYDSIQGNKEVFNVEPQFLFLVTNLCNKSKYSFPYRKELDAFISESVETNFAKNADIKPSIVDNYYGLALANKFGYKYDKIKMEKMLESFYTKYVEEDSNISDHRKFFTVYHLILSYKEMKLYVPDKHVLANSIEEYLSNLKYRDYKETASAIFDFKMGLEVIDILNVQPSKELKEKANETIQNVANMDDIFSSIVVTDLSDVIILNKFDTDKKESYMKKIFDTLNKLHSGGGYKAKDSSNGEPDINSTLLALKTKSYFGKLDAKEQGQAKNYLYSLKSEGNIFRISQSGSGADLKAIYEALYTSTYYR